MPKVFPWQRVNNDSKFTVDISDSYVLVFKLANRIIRINDPTGRTGKAFIVS